MSSQIEQTIIDLIDDEQRVEGFEHLAYEHLQCRNRHWVRQILMRLEAQGLIKIIRSCGGRGNKTIYKRNRNQAGLARKARHA